MNLDLLRPEICLAITALAAIVADLAFQTQGGRHNRKPDWHSASQRDWHFRSWIKTRRQSETACLRLDNYRRLLQILVPGSGIYGHSGFGGLCQAGCSDFHGEFHALILTAALGAMLTAAATDIISILLSVELTAISFYALVGFLKDGKASESSLKYILLGAINSAVLLYGLAMLFGFSGSTHLAGIAQAVASIPSHGIAGERRPAFRTGAGAVPVSVLKSPPCRSTCGRPMSMKEPHLRSPCIFRRPAKSPGSPSCCGFCSPALSSR